MIRQELFGVMLGILQAAQCRPKPHSSAAPCRLADPISADLPSIGPRWTSRSALGRCRPKGLRARATEPSSPALPAELPDPSMPCACGGATKIRLCQSCLPAAMRCASAEPCVSSVAMESRRPTKGQAGWQLVPLPAPHDPPARPACWCVAHCWPPGSAERLLGA